MGRLLPVRSLVCSFRRSLRLPRCRFARKSRFNLLPALSVACSVGSRFLGLLGPRRGDYMPGHPGSLFCGTFRTYTGFSTTYTGSSTTLASVCAEDDVLAVLFRALLTRKRGCLGRFRAVLLVCRPCGRLSALFVAPFVFLGVALPGNVGSTSSLRSLWPVLWDLGS